MRFNDLTWNHATLSQFASKINEKNRNSKIKNVISNSANFGLISQKEYFDREIINIENIEGYYIIRENDFIYNPRKSINAPYGPINLYTSTETGIVSPLYLCFKVCGINKMFLYYYFKSNVWHRYMYMNGDSGARSDRVSIKDSVFFNMPIWFPNTDCQVKIGKLLTLIHTRINTQIKIIEVLESLKKFLCYQMTHVKADKVMFSKICDFMPKTSHKSSDGLNDGDYVFYTNEETTKLKFNNYDFDGEYIIANTGGKANFKLVTGKFAVMSDCLVIKLIKNSIAKFYYYYLQFNKNYIDRQGFEGSGLKHLNKDWLLKLNVPIINNDHLNYLALLEKIDKKIKIENSILSNIKLQKEYLLDNMFI